MDKCRLQLNNSIQIGRDSPTALNILIGANNEEQYCYELKKIEALNDCNLPISIVTDLSLYKRPGKELWRQIITDHRFVAGTVPIYQAVCKNKMVSPTHLLEIINEQAERGVTLMTIHPTPDFELLEMSKSRLVPITSSGGAAVSTDMLLRRSEKNVYLQIIDEILKIATTYSITLSIGTSFRSANLQDTMDQTYLLELTKQLKIADYCSQFGVNVLIETPGHASPQDIFSICDRLNQCCPYPIMPLGPMPTDCALKHDDLAATIGAVLMGTHGCADILSVVTREEHIGGIPTIESIISAIEKYSVVKHRSCILGTERNCNRCEDVCPLNLAHMLKHI